QIFIDLRLGSSIGRFSARHRDFRKNALAAIACELQVRLSRICADGCHYSDKNRFPIRAIELEHAVRTSLSQLICAGWKSLLLRMKGEWYISHFSQILSTEAGGPEQRGESRGQ